MLQLFTFLFTAIIWASNGHADSKLKLSDSKQQISETEELLNKGECKKAWTLIWPRIARQDTIALREFSKLSLKYYFRLPGQSDDQLSILRRVFLFGVYGFDPNDADTKESMLDFLTTLDPAISGNALVLRSCFESAKTSADVTTCQGEAQDSHLIPSYKNFMSELKRDSGSSGSFFCAFLGNKFIPFHKQ